MFSQKFWIFSGAGFVAVLGAGCVLVVWVAFRTLADHNVVSGPTLSPAVHNAAEEEGQKVLQGMYQHPKTTQPVRGLFATEEATSRPR